MPFSSRLEHTSYRKNMVVFIWNVLVIQSQPGRKDGSVLIENAYAYLPADALCHDEERLCKPSFKGLMP